MQSVIGALRVILGADTAAFEKGLNEAQRTLTRTAKQMQKVGDGMSRIGQTMSLAITTPILAAGAAMTKAAIDAGEMQSAFNVSFGAMAKDAEAWAVKTGDALGRSTQEMQGAMLTMHGLFKAGGPATDQTRKLSEQFAVLAQDLSSFHNVSPEDALDRLRAGLSGEAEPLRKFNVYLNEAAVKAKAMELGLVGANGALSEQAKIQARAALIMEGTTEAQGDVLRTQDSAANQIRKAQAAWQELSVTVGTKIIPLLTPIVTKVAELLTWFGQLSPAVQNFVMVGAALAAALGPVLMALGSLVTIMSTVLPLLAAPAVAAAAPFIAVAAAAAGLAWLFRDDLIPLAKEMWATLVETLGPKIKPLVEAAQNLFAALGDLLARIFSPGSPASNALAAWFEGIKRIFGGVVQLLGGGLDFITNIFNALAAALRGDWSAVWGYLGQAVKGALGGIGRAFAALFPEVIRWVSQLYNGVKSWLFDKFSALVQRIGQYVGMVGDFFYRLWDRVVGHSYVPDLIIAIGQWFEKLDAGMVKPARNATSAVAQEFENLRSRVAVILDGMLTDEQRWARQMAQDIATLEEAIKKDPANAATYREALKAKYGELWTGHGGVKPPEPIDNGPLEKPWEQEGSPWSKPDPEDEKNAKTTGTLMAEFFSEGLQGLLSGEKDWWKRWLSDWASRGLQDAFKTLQDLLGKIFDHLGEALKSTQSGTGGGGLGSLFAGIGKIFGFANGGSFEFGGSGGIDSKLAVMRVTPGEQGAIWKRGQAPFGGGGRPVHFDLRGAVMTKDLLAQMQTMANNAEGRAISKSTRIAARQAPGVVSDAQRKGRMA